MTAPHVVLVTEPLWGRRDRRLPAGAWWLAAGDRTLVEHELEALACAGFEAVTLQTEDAAGWSVRPPRSGATVRVQPTRQRATLERLDELLLIEQRPLLVVEAGRGVDPGELQVLARACEAGGQSAGVLLHGGQVVAAYVEATVGAEVLADLPRRAEVRIRSLRGARRTSTSELWAALAEITGGRGCPEGWAERAPGVFAHPSARIRQDSLDRCRGPVFLHEGATVGEGVSLSGPVVVGPRSQVGAGVTADRAFVGPATQVADGVELTGALVVGTAVWQHDDDVWADVEPGAGSDVPAPTDAWGLVEQAIERSLAGLALLLFAPVLAVAAVAIRAHDGGSILYRGRRCAQPSASDQGPGWRRSRAGRFVGYPVLRTMTPQADRAIGAMDASNAYTSGPFRKASEDPRVTPVGRWLRKASIDELPLLWEVFCGRLRLTGVWALPTYEATELADARAMGELAPIGQLRFRGAPGLAGYWQARDRKSHDPVARIVHDAYQAVVLSPGGPLSPRERVGRRLALAVETVLSALKLSGV